VLSTRPVPALTHVQIELACAACTGEIDQVPPMYSALKHEGRALYEYAREGVEIEREARCITIHRIDILSWQADSLEIEVHCSKGTYIRTLAESLGEFLGCGAHLVALRRTGSGLLALQGAVTLDALVAMSEAERDTHLQPVDTLVADWPSVTLDASEAGRFLTGLRRRVTVADMPHVRVYGPVPRADAHQQGTSPAKAPQVFLGSAHVKAGELIPTRLLSPVEVQGLALSQACSPI
jgi:tRNA pseudouridine55 synthase